MFCDKTIHVVGQYSYFIEQLYDIAFIQVFLKNGKSRYP